MDLLEVNEAFRFHRGRDQGAGAGSGKGQRQRRCRGAGPSHRGQRARVLVTLLYAMKDRGRRGMVCLCLGGGEAVSLIVENLV